MTAQTLRSVLEEGNGSIKTGPFGTVLSAAEYVEDGVPLISVGEIGYGSLQLRSTTPRISADTVERLPDYVLRTGDVVFGRKGAVDRSSRVRPEEDGWFLGSDGIRVRFGRNVDPTYMAYCLLNPAVREWLLRHAGGSTLKSLNERTLGEVPLSTPFLAEQRAIAEVLGALDDKIAANDVLRRTAAQLATARYLVSLLPEMQSVAVADACTVLSRGASPRYTEDAAAMLVLNQKCIRGGKVDLAPARRTEPDRVRADTVLQVDDVLVNSTGMGTLGRVAAWDRAGVATVDSHITIARPDPRVVDPAVFGVALMEMQSEIEGLAEGSTGQTELSRQQLGALVVPLPARSWQGDLGSLVRSLSKRSLAAAEESRQLAALRDALLPELMSGRLRVKDAEKTVEEVV